MRARVLPEEQRVRAMDKNGGSVFEQGVALARLKHILTATKKPPAGGLVNNKPSGRYSLHRRIFLPVPHHRQQTLQRDKGEQ